MDGGDGTKLPLKIQVRVPSALVGQNIEVWCLKTVRGLFDLAEVRGLGSKVSQIRLSKSRSREFLCSEGAGREGVPGTEREVFSHRLLGVSSWLQLP